MTHEDKELLFKDLCARLPYGVKVQSTFYKCDGTIWKYENEILTAGLLEYPITRYKLYLFPLSSMTEEQKREYHYIVNYISPDDTENWEEGEFIYVNQIEQLLHFYHTNHLDYRGLIEKGLAIDATGLNIY